MALQTAPSIVDAAKAFTVAYNKKDWNAVKTSMTTHAVYDEIATQRKAEGPENILKVLKGWASAMPDSNATFDHVFTSGRTVVLEVTWHGKHTGPLSMPNGEVAPTGKKIELRACQVVDLDGDKVAACRQYFDMGTLKSQLGIS